MTLLSTGTDYEQLAATFRPIFARIAQGAAAREQNRILPDEQIRWLKEAGFGTVRIPREKGGWGASLPQLIALLIELAHAAAYKYAVSKRRSSATEYTEC